VVAAVAVSAVVAGAVGAGAGWLAARSVESVTVAIDDPAGTALSVSAGLDVGAVLEVAGPSVVAVQTTVEYRQGPFRATGQSAGTGIVLTSDGQVLTNAHVVESATSITVTLPGETDARPARLLGADTAADVAVIQVLDASGLTTAVIGDPDALEVGDDVVAIGNALDLGAEPTVTRGIVSALDRSIETSGGVLTGLIQTDAAISSGNSGGALVDAQGRLVGMNSAGAVSGGGVAAENIGFAIPIDVALEVAAGLGASVSASPS
jgi:putative serine protease PepD